MRLARSTTGEARFNHAKRFATLLLNDLLPEFLKSLAYLEAVRINKSVVGRGQADSLGQLVRGLRASLPGIAADFVTLDAHHVRNAFAHGHAHWDHVSDCVELSDQDWSRRIPTESLLLELQTMFENVVSAAGVLVTSAAAYVAERAYEDVDFELMKQNQVDWRMFASRLMYGGFIRGEAWFNVLSPDWRSRIAELKAQGILLIP